MWSIETPLTMVLKNILSCGYHWRPSINYVRKIFGILDPFPQLSVIGADLLNTRNLPTGHTRLPLCRHTLWMASYFNALTSMILYADFKQPIRWRSFFYDTNMEYRVAKRCNCFAKQYPGNAGQKFSEPGMILLAKPSKKNLISASPLSSMTMA